MQSNRPKSCKKTLPRTRRTASYRETERRFSLSSPFCKASRPPHRTPQPGPPRPRGEAAAPEDRRYGRHRALAAGLCLPNGPADSPSPAAEGRDPPPSPRDPAPPQPPRRGRTAGARRSHGNSTHHGRRAAGEVRPTRQRAGAGQDPHSPPAEGERGPTAAPVPLPLPAARSASAAPAGVEVGEPGDAKAPARASAGACAARWRPRRGQPLHVRADVPAPAGRWPWGVLLQRWPVGWWFSGGGRCPRPVLPRV